jgi:hypothetical protein
MSEEDIPTLLFIEWQDIPNLRSVYASQTICFVNRIISKTIITQLNNRIQITYLVLYHRECKNAMEKKRRKKKKA